MRPPSAQLGAEVQVWLTAPSTGLADAPRLQLGILKRMGVPIVVTGFEANDLLTLPPADLLIDALIGYSLVGQAKGTVAAVIDAANSHGAPVLALDVPSGPKHYHRGG